MCVRACVRACVFVCVLQGAFDNLVVITVRDVNSI
jgi:hypothetical protein